MEFGKVDIPTEVYLDFLSETVPIHWDNHAYLMVFIWLVLVPICIIVIRFGKPEPTERASRRRSVCSIRFGGGFRCTNTAFTWR